MRFQNLIGKTFGRLLVVSRSEVKSKNIRWDCLCSCGNTLSTLGDSLKNGDTKSCGCLRREVCKNNSPIKHGMIDSPEYYVWRGMKSRCGNKSHPQYFRYGGRGIKVCAEWLDSFKQFYADMGDRPSNDHTIDRIDNDGIYQPNNCKWSTAEEQANNRSNSILITFNGKVKTLAMWCKHFKLDYKVIHQRYSSGFAVPELFILKAD